MSSSRWSSPSSSPSPTRTRANNRSREETQRQLSHLLSLGNRAFDDDQNVALFNTLKHRVSLMPTAMRSEFENQILQLDQLLAQTSLFETQFDNPAVAVAAAAASAAHRNQFLPVAPVAKRRASKQGRQSMLKSPESSPQSYNGDKIYSSREGRLYANPRRASKQVGADGKPMVKSLSAFAKRENKKSCLSKNGFFGRMCKRRKGRLCPSLCPRREKDDAAKKPLLCEEGRSPRRSGSINPPRIPATT